MKTCGDCVYFLEGSLECLEWKKQRHENDQACNRFHAAIGHRRGIDFKPVLTVQITPE